VTGVDEPTVKVQVSTEAEMHPVLDIREGDSHYEIPVALLSALTHAQKAVAAAETAIMEYIGAAYPGPTAVHEWLEDAALGAARARYVAAHPDGPEWRLVPVRERQRLIDAAKVR
jgi:hypothetical protein